MRRLAVCVLPVLAGALLGCPNNDPLACIDDVTLDLACQPLYPPTFDNAFATTFAKKCSTGGGSCHSIAGHKNGLVLETVDQAFTTLTDPTKERVVPGEPSCSVMVERLFSKNPDLQMPPGSKLSNAERCALVQWVAAGALRQPPDANLPDAPSPDAGVDAPVDAP